MNPAGSPWPTLPFGDVGWAYNTDPTLPLAAACLAALFTVALTAGAETALQQVGVHRLRRVLDPNARPSDADDSKHEADHSRLLISLQALHIIMLFCLGGLAIGVLGDLMTGSAFAGSLVLSLGTVLATEVLARAYARQHSQGFARVVLPVCVGLTRVAAPVLWLLLLFVRPFLPRKLETVALGSQGLENLEEDIRQLAHRGLLEQDQGEILQSVFQFRETIAKEVMVPRVDMVCVEMGVSLHQVLDLMIQCGYTRLPVYGESVDEILGLVHAKDLLRKLDSPNPQEIRQKPILQEDLREILVVPATKLISKILRELQQKQGTMAIVVDEYGGTDGLLTLEDIVEEIVGEITDEYDQAHEGLQLLKDGSSVVDAKIVLEDVNEFLRLDLPVDEHETLGGFVYGLFGRVPKAGESVTLDKLKFTVESVQKQRIKRVHIERIEPVAPTPKEEKTAGVSS